MASDNSNYFSFADQMSASNVRYSGQMQSSYKQEGSWAAGETAGSYTGFDQKPFYAPSFQTSIMSDQGIAAYPQQQQQQRFYRPQHNRQPQPKKQPAQPQTIYCEICRVSCAGPQPYADHLKGQKHKKKEASQSIQQNPDQCPKPTKAANSAANQLRCELCDVTCGSADTFAAHVRGVKHLRVLNLHAAMGKPVPTITVPQVPQASKTSFSTPASTPSAAVSTLAPSVPAKAPAIPTPGTKPEAEGTNVAPTAVVTDATEKVGSEKAAAADVSEIVGQEFIEEVKNEKGLVVSYNCKLCECSFTDPNARRVHLKGRRHRLQYKKKIDSTVEVDVKVNARTQKVREERNRKQVAKESYWRQQDLILGMRMETNQVDFEQWNRPRYTMGPRHNTQDDRYMINKHMDLYPPKEEMAEVHLAILAFENALKLVSDVIAAEDAPAKKTDPPKTSEATVKSVEAEKTTEKMATEEVSQDTEKETVETTATEAADCEAARLIKGAMRVGLLSKGLLLQGDLAEHLVVICAEYPTRTLLQRIIDHLPAQLKIVSPLKKSNIEARFEESGLVVTIEEPATSFAVTLTSMLVVEDQVQVDPAPSSAPSDQLSPGHCLSALALLRHTKWFQVRLCAMKAGTVVAHVLRDFCRRNPIWTPLSEWAQVLLVEKGIFAAGIDIGPGEALRSFFECISSGILLPGGHGLMDPCEKVPTDVTAYLTRQQCEDITASAHQFLRLLVYRQMYKILDVAQFKRPGFKRRREQDDKPESADEKKQKQEEGPAVEGNGTVEGNGAASEDPPVIIID